MIVDVGIILLTIQQRQLREINKKIDGLEESRFVLKEMSQETFDKFYPRYIKERENIAAQLDKCKLGISNPEDAIQYCIITFF